MPDDPSKLRITEDERMEFLKKLELPKHPSTGEMLGAAWLLPTKAELCAWDIWQVLKKHDVEMLEGFIACIAMAEYICRTCGGTLEQFHAAIEERWNSKHNGLQIK